MHYVLKLYSGVKKNCYHYDSNCGNNEVNCLLCDNADYQIIREDGLILVDFKDKNRVKINEEVLLIETFDTVDEKNMLEYLTNSKSDYRMINSHNNRVVRPLKSDPTVFEKDNVFMNLIMENNEFILYATYFSNTFILQRKDGLKINFDCDGVAISLYKKFLEQKCLVNYDHVSTNYNFRLSLDEKSLIMFVNSKKQDFNLVKSLENLKKKLIRK